MKVLVTTHPFGQIDELPIRLLEKSGVDFTINPLGRKFTESDLIEFVQQFDILIAGTEPITSNVINSAGKLKLISRVGIGLDNIDLVAAKRKGIVISYTPDAPAPAVSELTVGLIFSLLRFIHLSNLKMHRSEWKRYFGRRISDVTFGIIGAGRIGSRVIESLLLLGARNILVNDLDMNISIKYAKNGKISFVEKDQIYRNCDVISLHVPLTKFTENLINKNVLSIMKREAVLVNTSRGGVVDESALADSLLSGFIGGAAIDVFSEEPYNGPLSLVENCLLTSHMGSMSVDCRGKMEIEATEEAIRFIKGETLQQVIPNELYSKINYE